MHAKILVVLTIAALALSSGCSDPNDVPVERIVEAAEGCNIVGVTIDAAARDHLGCYGYSRDTTPRLDEIAAESVVFDEAYAQASGTMLSVFSYFTSRYPVFGDRIIWVVAVP